MSCSRPAACGSPLIDAYRRRVTYLRVSVTDRCDLRCVYCMSEQMSFLPRRDLLSLEELDRLCSAFVERGVDDPREGPHGRDLPDWGRRREK